MRKFSCLACGASTERQPQSRSNFCLSCLHRHSDEGWAAIIAVRKAIKSGQLQRASTLACVDCAKPARDYDHRDYTKPLDVAPVCRSCNQKRGQAFNSFYRPQSEMAAA